METENAVGKLLSAGVFAEVERRLRQGLREDGESPDRLSRLADAMRQQGDLRGAAAVARRASALRPDDPALGYAAGALAGDLRGLARPLGAVAVPVVVQSPVFADVDHHRFLAAARSDEAAYVSSSVQLPDAEAYYSPDHRNTWDKPLDGPLRAHFKKVMNGRLRKAMARIGCPPPDEFTTEIKFTLYRDGSRFLCHHDCDVGRRQVTALLYLHGAPKAFSGGDLVLFDTDRETAAPGYGFTFVPCRSNTLVVFPSWGIHEVLQLSVPGDRFQDARFAIGCHFGWDR